MGKEVKTSLRLLENAHKPPEIPWNPLKHYNPWNAPSPPKTPLIPTETPRELLVFTCNVSDTPGNPQKSPEAAWNTPGRLWDSWYNLKTLKTLWNAPETRCNCYEAPWSPSKTPESLFDTKKKTQNSLDPLWNPMRLPGLPLESPEAR